MNPNKTFPLGSEKDPPVSLTTQEPENTVTPEKMLTDTDELLSQFSADYQRMAE